MKPLARDILWLVGWITGGMLISFTVASAAPGQQVRPLPPTGPMPAPSGGVMFPTAPGHISSAGYPYSTGMTPPLGGGVSGTASPNSTIIAGPGGPVLLAPGETLVGPIGEPIVTDQCVIIPSQPAKPPSHRNGVLQKASVDATFLPRNDDDEVGFTDIESFVTLGFPFPTLDTPLVVTFGADTHFIDGPVAPDLPPRVYDTYAQIRSIRKFGEQWALDISATPGYHTDFDNTSSDAFRIPGYIVLAYNWTPSVMFVAGAAYMDRDDVGWVPAGGVIWNPNDDVRIELITPRPKVAYRVHNSMSAADWLYVAGEFGGGQWAIERADGTDDVITSSDFRAVLGYERKSNTGGFSGRMEVAYVFGRDIEYRSGTPTIELEDTVMVRSGISY